MAKLFVIVHTFESLIENVYAFESEREARDYARQLIDTPEFDSDADDLGDYPDCDEEVIVEEVEYGIGVQNGSTRILTLAT